MGFLVVDSNTHFGFLPHKDTDVSAEKLTSSMRQNGVAAALTHSVYMEFCCGALETDKVRRMVEMAGADRVLFGSDLDLIHPGIIAGSYEEAGLGREDLEKILNRNAASIFGIQP